MVLRVSLACIHVSGIEKKWSWWLERDGKKKKKEKKDGFRQPEFLFFEKKNSVRCFVLDRQRKGKINFPRLRIYYQVVYLVHLEK